MSDSPQRALSYRKLFARLDEVGARNLIDRLQVLALTRPEMLRELEAFLDRDDGKSPLPSTEDCDTTARA
jgi:hypothetical protein